MMGSTSDSVKSFHESFYGTPTVDESRRRRGKKRHSTLKEVPQNEVAVVGSHYRSFDDDSMAAFVNSATALVPWNGDAKLLIDRYDVRHLLQDLTGIRRRRARPPSPDATKEELDYERFRDVEGLENPIVPEDDPLVDENAAVGGYQRVGFNYDNSGDLAAQKGRAEDTLFTPSFFVPEHLRMKIPTSTKLHQIMAGTAKYVIEHGGQAEIVLRVKQASNSTFGFLMPDHHDHDYFRFLVAHPEHVGIGSSQEQQPVEAAGEQVGAAVDSGGEEAEGGLSLLGTAYGDADDDEGEGGGKNEGVISADDVAQDQQRAAAAEASGSPDDKAVQQGDDSSVMIAADKEASVFEQDATDSQSVALIETGEAADMPEEGQTNASDELQEPAPPGIEAPADEAAQGAESGKDNISEAADHVPLYKEPPLQLRRIIDKMVEFISRNGQEFEAIVRERDKANQRFPFLLPWNEHYPYYSQELQASTEARAAGEGEVGVPSTIESADATEGGGVSGTERVQDSFLDSVPFWDELWNGGVPNSETEGGVSEIQGTTTDRSPEEVSGMDIDAVLAAVRAATRSRAPRVSAERDGEEAAAIAAGAADLLKASGRPEMGSDEAVLAAIRAATRRSKSDYSIGDFLQLEASSAAPVSMVTDVVQTAPPTSSNTEAVVVDANGADVRNAHVEAKLALAPSSAPVQDGELPDPMPQPQDKPKPEPALPPAEKRKAERLKKAKLFAAMIKDGKGAALDSSDRQLSGSLGVPAGLIFDRLNLSAVPKITKSPGDKAGETAVEPEKREHIDSSEQTDVAHPQAVVVPSADDEAPGSDLKEARSKRKTTDVDEKHGKHHHKRKKEKERGSESKASPEKKEKRKHRHHQDGKKKDRKRAHEVEGQAMDEDSRYLETEEKLDTKDFEPSRKYLEEDVMDRSHHSRDSGRKRRASKHSPEKKKISSRHRHDSDGVWRESSNYAHDGDRAYREHSRHLQDSERPRKESRYAQESHSRRDEHYRYDGAAGEGRRKESSSRHRHNSEERSSVDRYGRDVDEIRRDRSYYHGKRRKHRDSSDEEIDETHSRRDEHRSRKSRRHDIDDDHHKDNGDDDDDDRGHAVRHRSKETQKHDHRKDRKLGDVAAEKPDVSGGGGQLKAQPSLSSADVPDDIRAKVRAMLALM